MGPWVHHTHKHEVTFVLSLGSPALSALLGASPAVLFGIYERPAGAYACATQNWADQALTDPCTASQRSKKRSPLLSVFKQLDPPAACAAGPKKGMPAAACYAGHGMPRNYPSHMALGGSSLFVCAKFNSSAMRL